ncbi:hypothetical protein ANCCAN_16599 [Ancylostoma caninum]|uniref:Uncharacterized protein n=1 Tax=Ancylostoma caninum TaxID=29170 RepID=A0A368G2K6_ANCCA|nr:hypothetical protein ANCCAN_16599 [Ancylostoma caninum]
MIKFPGVEGKGKGNQAEEEGSSGAGGKGRVAFGGFRDLWKNLWGNQAKQGQQNDNKSLLGTLGSLGKTLGGIAKKAGEVVVRMAGDLIGVDGENIIETFRVRNFKMCLLSANARLKQPGRSHAARGL